MHDGPLTIPDKIKLIQLIEFEELLNGTLINNQLKKK